MQDLSFTEENYLKAIYSLNEAEPKSASTNSIANRLQTSAASVSDMLKKLKEKKLIHYKRYQAAELSETGRKHAVSVIRKHRLWEYFLVEKLAFGWDEVHDLAEQLEHIKSVQLTNRLDQFLGFPKFDPHGDPIPDQSGNFPHKLELTLADLKAKDVAIVIGVKDHSSSFFNHLNYLEINLGSELEVLRVNEFDQSFEIKSNQISKSISNAIAQNLFVKSINKND